MPQRPDCILTIAPVLCGARFCCSPPNSVSKQTVNCPSFMVRKDSERHIGLSYKSPYSTGRPGRLARKKLAAKGGGDDAQDSN